MKINFDLLSKIGASRHILAAFPDFFFVMLPVLNAKCGFYKVCELVISVCLSSYTGPSNFLAARRLCS